MGPFRQQAAHHYGSELDLGANRLDANSAPPLPSCEIWSKSVNLSAL